MAAQTETTRLADLVELVRIRACLAGGASVLLGAFLTGGLARLTAARGITESAAIALAVATANVVNDVVDMRADAAGGRSRPLAAGRLPVRAAQATAIVLAAGALLLSFAAGKTPGIEMSGLLALAIAYSYVFKSTVLLGNVVVACCASFPVVYGGEQAGAVPARVWAAAALSFLFMLCYETLKTLRDREADAAAELRTLATRTEPRSSARLFMSCVVVLSLALLAASTVSPLAVPYLVSIAPLLGLLAVATLPFARDQPGDPAIERSLRLLRIAWLVGLLDMVLLR